MNVNQQQPAKRQNHIDLKQVPLRFGLLSKFRKSADLRGF